MDENVDGAIADGLRRQGLNVTTTPEMNLLGATDKEQVVFALSQSRVIFTHDADFLRLHQRGVEHSGIAFARQGNRSIREILQSLLQIYNSQSLDSMRNHIEFI